MIVFTPPTSQFVLSDVSHPAVNATCAPNYFCCHLESSESDPISKKWVPNLLVWPCKCQFIFLIWFIRCDGKYGEDEEGCSSCEHAGFFRCPGELKFINTTWVTTVWRIVRTVRMTSWSCASLRRHSCLEFRSVFAFQWKGGHCIDLKYMCDGHSDNCSKFSHPRTLNQALNLFSFTFQVNHAKTTADVRICVSRPRKLQFLSAMWVTTPLMMDGNA